jgi:hypothetical protein
MVDMTKRQLIDDIRTMNHSAHPSFLARFESDDLQRYLDHLHVARKPRLSGDPHRYDRYFQFNTEPYAPAVAQETEEAPVVAEEPADVIDFAFEPVDEETITPEPQLDEPERDLPAAAHEAEEEQDAPSAVEAPAPPRPQVAKPALVTPDGNPGIIEEESESWLF